MRIATLALIHSAAEYCAPVWSQSAHTRLINKPMYDALRLVTGCLRPTPTADVLFVLSGITPTELCRKKTTLSLACRAQEPGHLLHDRLTSHPYGGHRQLKSRHPFGLVLWICSEMQANWAPVQQDGRTTGGALSGGRALLVCIHFLMMWTPFHLELAFKAQQV